jgi:hypothetical protein
MENDKKDFTIDRILKVFDQYIQLEDRVALIRFNETFESVFDLTPKSENTNYLRSAIENQKQVTPKGQSGLLQAILHSFTVFEKHTDLGHSKWLIVLSDGEDNISSISKKKMEKLVKKYSEISLIVIGVAINPDCSEELNDLCRLTKEGFFISSVESEDVDIAFQSLANLIYGSSALEYVEE